MYCTQDLDFYMSISLLIIGLLFFLRQGNKPARYGKHIQKEYKQTCILVSAKFGWFIQELPSFLIPLVIILYNGSCHTTGCKMLLFMFCGHYFQRTFIYSAFTRGSPTPLYIVAMAVLFCSYNGFLQAHCMVFVAAYPNDWYMDIRFLLGVVIFFLGMSINLHSDHILRNLRKPTEVTYKIPQGGMFNFVTGANFLGEIVEWYGFAIATWSLPAFAFALFTMSCIGPRAYHHHKFYLQTFKDYPKNRKVLIPFIF
ncbi:3-oxo-5-alpha-steroid 4-dehydrogenase 2 [Hyla sarda]|uniref:3-oxo-5-alpha-steroid 4-dehydrogenase 2 n=1 Tax=Hyla sarda TaxID=327740 RepID=UPI0024C45DD6|nr:3-oxo-5-alpha-steroid 4-dehydrogenase 2 [Hyla sarda]XP_056423136.1 3-oxo-5-alpha-steroid 4-dehydrogenase 2 [Hyla sarda]